MPEVVPSGRSTDWEIRVEQYVALLQSVLDDCHRQRDLIAAGDLTSLMRLLSEKGPRVQRLHGEAAEINQEFVGGGLAGQLPGDAAAVERRKAMRDRCVKLGEEILEMERLCEAELTQSREQTADQIQTLSRSADASMQYRAVDASPGGAADSTAGGSIDFQCG